MQRVFTKRVCHARAAAEVGIPNLVHALKAGLTSHFVTLKLTKKGASPYLTVDAQVNMRVY